jgi:two-component system OmpR family sensor kinase
MTLRTRLIATVVVLTAAALLVLAAVTYASQRGALLDQVDDQLGTAQNGVVQRLARENGLTIGNGPAVPPGARRGRPFGSFGGDRGPDDDAVGRGGGDLQPGTYAELRSASGTKVGRATGANPSFDAEALAAPVLPAVLRPGMTFTASAAGDDGLRYRVRTIARPAGAPVPGSFGDATTGGTRTTTGSSGATGATTKDTTSTAKSAGAVRAALTSGFTVVAVPLTDVDDTLGRLLRTEAIVIALALALLTGVSWLLVRIGLRPLDRMATTAGEIAAGDLDQRVRDASPKTEVGRLGIALNGMLGRLEGAFAEREASEGRLRQFLSDASHELRTPLASIRGYAELFRVGAVQDPEDLKKAMGRIEDEAARMGVLVEDLLVLARLDEAPEKSYGPVDVALIAEDAAEDARAMDPSRTVTASGAAEAVVTGDDGQLRQVLTNLVRNALVHTPAGTPVEITTTAANGHVELEVRDHGAGLPAEDPQAIFGRFWRSEGGRTRGKSGAGLGLAIVAAIVEAHDGTVRATNAPDGGASFVVRLPLRG